MKESVVQHKVTEEYLTLSQCFVLFKVYSPHCFILMRFDWLFPGQMDILFLLSDEHTEAWRG